MPLPLDLFDQPAPEAARRLARQHLDDARAARDRLGSDTEALHDFRVALRRLRSVLRAYAPVLEDTVGRGRRRALGKVAAATGESRDAEVHVEWLRAQAPLVAAEERAGVEWLVARLEARKREGDATIATRTLDRFATLAVRLDDELARWHEPRRLDEARINPTFGAVTAGLLRDAAEELRIALGLVQSPADQALAHEARIAGKRLRYLLEPVVEVLAIGREPVKALRELQDGLGDLHDAHLFAPEIVHATEVAAEDADRADAEGVAAGESPDAVRRRLHGADPRPGLRALAARVRERGDAAWQAVESRWLHGRAADFLGHVHALAGTLAAREGEGVEIERKYLLSSLPPAVRDAPALEVDQGYLPGERLVERVRRTRDADGVERYFRTVKGGRGVSRIELEEETTPALFAALWALTDGCRVRKRRYLVAEGARTWEIDEFLDRTLFLAEIELDAADEAVTFPAWLAPHVERDVTLDAAYGNRSLAK